MQELHPLAHSILVLRGRACHVAARSCETGNEAATYGVTDDREDNRYRCGRIFHGQSRGSTKQLQVWANDRWILLERKRITVLRPEALARIVRDE
jgi:hypothetical protein